MQKSSVTIVSLTVALCLLGCSKNVSTSNDKPNGFVPLTSAEVVASPQFKRLHTTKSGVQFYIREVTAKEHHYIPKDSRDLDYLNGDEGSSFFLVPIRGNEILLDSELTGEELGELMNALMPRAEKLMQEAFKGHTR